MTLLIRIRERRLLNKYASPRLFGQISYVLTINVNKFVGYLGETFLFSGRYTGDGVPLAGRLVTLYHGTTSVGTSFTNINGDYQIPWVANILGSTSFYTTAPEPS